MLHASPTKKGTGLVLFGCADDLKSLHETIHFLCGGPEGASYNQEDALSIAYEIRKAFEMKREIRSFESGEQYGTQFVWPQIIFYVSYFRHVAAFRPTNKEHLANLMRLEYCLESALIEYDAKIGNEVLSLYPIVGSVTAGFYHGYISDITYSYLYESGSGKIRFRRLPALVSSMAQFSSEYRAYADFLEREAKRRGCLPSQLQDSREWSEIEW